MINDKGWYSLVPHCLFKQYNKLIDNNIIPVSVSVDGIEVKEKCDELFDLGAGAQWKKESVYIRMISERNNSS